MNIRDLPENKGGGKLLKRAIEKFKYPTIYGLLDDDTGTFAYEVDDYILTAKKYIYGNMVSCHKRAIYAALNQNKLILMYIADADKFYRFNPEAIIKDKETVFNKKGENEMINFRIKLGVWHQV